MFRPRLCAPLLDMENQIGITTLTVEDRPRDQALGSRRLSDSDPIVAS